MPPCLPQPQPLRPLFPLHSPLTPWRGTMMELGAVVAVADGCEVPLFSAVNSYILT
jgi:hypothetical protein